MAKEVAAIDRARVALSRSDWAGAYDGFRAADRSTLGAPDLEGLADAAWWVSRFAESLDARQKAYAAYDAAGDERAAGGVAARLAIEHFSRDEPSVGSGYLMRARRHLEDQPPCRERGFFVMVAANVARYGGELDGALALALEAEAIADVVGDRDLVAMSIHTEGLVRVRMGEVARGIALMDEAMSAVLAGDLSPYFTGIIYCNLIQACLQLGDIRRAGEWSDAARVWCDTLRPDSPFPPMCRVNRAEVARLRGAWPEAEAEALLATQELTDTESELVASAFVQVGEIRRRMGDLDGAEAAFERARGLGADPAPALALLRLAQGKIEAARATLRSVPAEDGDDPGRVPWLAATVEVAIAADDLAEATEAVAGLRTIAARTSTPAFAAVADWSAGAVALAEGHLDAARNDLHRAIAAWQELRLPYEAARARVLYAQALRATDGEEMAAGELRAALATFARLGAAPDVAATERLLGTPEPIPGGLTPRETEVLRLLASGSTDRDIAVELVISEHTVGRHLQNIYAKLGVSTRSAATAFAFEHGLA